MKKIFGLSAIALIALLSTFQVGFTSCTKEVLIHDTVTVIKKDTIVQVQKDTLPNLKGVWLGKWGDNFDPQINTYRLNIKDNNVVDINNSFADYVGTWKVEQCTFIASYVIEGQTLVMKAPVDSIRMEGTWRNITTDEHKGTFYLKKQ